MRRLKVMTLMGTIPELVRLSACIRAFDRYFDHVLVHTAQHKFYRHFKDFFEDVEVREPDTYLNVTHHEIEKMAGDLLAKTYALMVAERPDAVVVLGDGIAAFSAISARQLGIPFFHLEAGNRSQHPNRLEETCRRTVEALSDYHLTYTENHRTNLLTAGINRDRVFVIGSPMREALGRHQERITASPILPRLHLDNSSYLLLSAYRDTYAQDEGQIRFLVGLANQLVETFDLDVVYTTNPDIWSHIQEREIALHPRVRVLHSFGYYDLVKLHKSAYCVLSDSRTLPEEVSTVKFPAVMLRDREERMDALDKGSVILGGPCEADILRAVTLARAMWENGELSALHPDYHDINVSAKVVGIIQSCVRPDDGVACE